MICIFYNVKWGQKCLQKNKSQKTMFNEFRWNKSFQNEIRSSRVNTTLQLAEAIAAAKNPPKVWVSASAVGKHMCGFNFWMTLCDPS